MFLLMMCFNMENNMNNITCEQTEKFLYEVIMKNYDNEYVQSGKPVCPSIVDRALVIGIYQFKIEDGFYVAKVSLSNCSPSLTMREISWKRLTNEELINKKCKLF
jgi:hypothetical protein